MSRKEDSSTVSALAGLTKGFKGARKERVTYVVIGAIILVTLIGGWVTIRTFGDAPQETGTAEIGDINATQSGEGDEVNNNFQISL